MEPKRFTPNSLKARLALLSPLQRSVPLMYSEEMESLARKALAESDYDRVIAAAVLEVMREPELRESLSRGGQELVSAKYSAAAMGRAMNELMDRVVKGRAGGPAALP